MGNGSSSQPTNGEQPNGPATNTDNVPDNGPATNTDNLPVSGFSYFKPTTWWSNKPPVQPGQSQITGGGSKRKKGQSKKNNKNKRKTKKQKSVSN
jgi:hypothetical protein